MIKNDDFDELEYMIIRDRVYRFDTTNLGLTIAPTLYCNFNCIYCYEVGLKNNAMNRKVQGGIIEFVKKRIDRIKNFNVTWYGGEPLLNFEAIEYLSRSFLELVEDKVNYFASIVTNGYYLNKKTALKLRDLKIYNAQITIDGTPEIHNRRRALHNGKGTFDKIIKNIHDIWDIIRVNVRINVDKSNIDSLESFFQLPEVISLKDKVGFYLAPVDDFSNAYTNLDCYTMREFSEQEVYIMTKILEKGFNLMILPHMRPTICCSIGFNSFVIDPNGDIYKCWEHISRDEEKIGDVFGEIWNTKNLNQWLLYNAFDSPECRACKILPICQGGCPYYYFKTRKRKCRSIKYNYSNILEFISIVQNSNFKDVNILTHKEG